MLRIQTSIPPTLHTERVAEWPRYLAPLSAAACAGHEMRFQPMHAFSPSPAKLLDSGNLHHSSTGAQRPGAQCRKTAQYTCRSWIYSHCGWRTCKVPSGSSGGLESARPPVAKACATPRTIALPLLPRGNAHAHWPPSLAPRGLPAHLSIDVVSDSE